MEGETLITDSSEVCNTFNNYYINMADSIGSDESFDPASSLDTIADPFKEHPSIVKIKQYMNLTILMTVSVFNL